MSFPADTERLPTLEALERELLARGDSRPAPVYPRAALATAAIALVVAATALTPFGRAIAERVGDLVGVGDPPSREQANPVGEPWVVVGVGTYGGERFEIVASAASPSADGAAPTPCFSVDFPESSGTVVGGCMTPELVAATERDGITASATPSVGPSAPGRPTVVTGLAAGAASRVSIESATGRATQATLTRVPPEVREAIGLSDDLSFFVAFASVESGGVPSELVARALGRDGDELGRTRLSVATVAPPPAPQD